ncbi:MAG: hypothetical protein KA735_04900 [Burkholderiaceae bacterium]|nr:hypothetical protein [Burkholderiaceae bacterium]
MTIYTRPDEKVFASGAKPGEVVPFPDVLRGWGLTFEQAEGKPPMEWMNAAFLRADEAIRYLIQRGLPEWAAAEDYPAGAFVQHGIKAYRALTANSNVQPGTAAATWAELVPNASTTTKGLIEIATATEAKDLASALLAITPSTLGAVLEGYGSDLPRVKTFAQAVALTENVGPIIVIGMDGVWEWVETAYFTGYRHPRCGADEDGWTPEPLPFQISATGGTWRESDEKERRVIAVYREHGRVVTPANWKAGQDMIADIGGGNWKAPDKQNMFMRKSGTDADTANARTLGSYRIWSTRPLAIQTWSQSAFDSTGGPYLVGADVGGILGGLSSGMYPSPPAETAPVSTAAGPYVHA